MPDLPTSGLPDFRTSGPSPWWQHAFGPLYSEVYHHRDDAAAAAEIAGLLPRLRERPGPVIDAACGGGRHLAALRHAGISAHGFDLSPDLLALAAQREQCLGRLARGDLRRPPFAAGSCQAVLLLFTAFGYFDEAGNADCLAALAALLAPQGWMMIDLPERDHLRQTLVPESRRTTPRGLSVHERRTLVGERVEKTVVVEHDGRPVATWNESVRLYTPCEIDNLADVCGLSLVDCWPSLRGPESDDGRAIYWLRRTVA